MIPGVTVQAYGAPTVNTLAISLRQSESLAVANPRPRQFSLTIAQSMAFARSKALPKSIALPIGQSVARLALRLRLLSFLSPLAAALSKTSPPKIFSLLQSQRVAVNAPGPQAAAFLARTSGLDFAHTVAYSNLINGLVLDGVWAKLDVLYVFATANSTTALLNLVSSSFTGIANGSPNFVADRGFTGVDASTTVYIDSQFNPTTATSPHFTANSCHLSAWVNTAVTPSASGGCLVGSDGSSSANRSNVFARYSDGNAYFRINDSGSSGGFANASSAGHYIASRTGASASAGYSSGAVLGSPNAASGTLQNRNIFILALNNAGAPATGTGCQLTSASIGGGLTATDAANLYARLLAYLTTVMGANLLATQVTLQVLRSEA